MKFKAKSNYRFYLLFFFVFFLYIFPAYSSQERYKIGFLTVATGKYIQFIDPLIESARKYFCTNHDVTYFVFTDSELPQYDDVVKIYQSRLGWPYDTLMRCGIYHEHQELLQEMDYLFASDADMLFVDYVSDEILSERVATQHPGFVGRRGTYETRSISNACVQQNEGSQYFAGGFYGGNAQEFLKMAETMIKNIQVDLDKGIIAVWHDESHLNRYFVDNPPTQILSPSYCYPESWRLPYTKRLLALDKDHGAMRK